MKPVKELKDKCRKQRNEIKIVKKLSRTKAFIKKIDKLPEPINLFIKIDDGGWGMTAMLHQVACKHVHSSTQCKLI